MTRLFSKKTILINSLLLSLFVASHSFASRGHYYDLISLSPAGEITNLHTNGGVTAHLQTDNLFQIECKMVEDWSLIAYYLTGKSTYWHCSIDSGTISFTYTTHSEKVCQVTMIDGPDRKNASVKSSDCNYFYELKQQTSSHIPKNISELKLMTPESPTDISGM